MKKPRVLLADDHQIVLEGLKSLLAGEFDVVGSVQDGRALVDQAATLRPDVIVADISTRTVEFHKYRMMQQLNIKTSAQLVQYAVRHGIISV